MTAYTLKRTCAFSARATYYAGHGSMEIGGTTFHNMPTWTKDADLAAWIGDEDQAHLEADTWNDYSRTHGQPYSYDVHTVTG